MTAPAAFRAPKADIQTHAFNPNSTVSSTPKKTNLLPKIVSTTEEVNKLFHSANDRAQRKETITASDFAEFSKKLNRYQKELRIARKNLRTHKEIVLKDSDKRALNQYSININRLIHIKKIFKKHLEPSEKSDSYISEEPKQSESTFVNVNTADLLANDSDDLTSNEGWCDVAPDDEIVDIEWSSESSYSNH